MTPSEHRIARVMRETGMERYQAINHLRQRDELIRRHKPNWYQDRAS